MPAFFLVRSLAFRHDMRCRIYAMSFAQIMHRARPRSRQKVLCESARIANKFERNIALNTANEKPVFQLFSSMKKTGKFPMG